MIPRTTIGLVVGGLILLITALGWYFVRFVGGRSENWIVAGKRLTLPLAATTLMAQSLDSNATIGNADLTYQFGFWAGASLPVGLALCLFLTGLFFAKPLHAMNLLTLGDFYRVKYGRGVELVASIIMSVSFAVLLGGNLVALGKMFQFFFGIPFALGVLITATAAWIYITPGGLLADAYTDIVKTVVCAATVFVAFGWIATRLGISSPEGMGPFAVEQLFRLDKGGLINWATILALGLGDIVAIDFMERVFASESPATARRACYAGALGTLAIGIPFTLIALTATSVLDVAVPLPADAPPVMFTFLAQSFPPLLAAFVLAGMVAASMSTADGAIIGTSSVIARNILGVQPGSGTRRDRLLLASRLTTIPVVGLGILIAVVVPHTAILLILAFDITFAALLVPLVLGLFWPRASPRAAMFSILAGLLARVIMFLLTPTLYGLPNDILFIPNRSLLALTRPETGVAVWDGLPTLLAPVVGLVAFVAVAYLGPSRTTSRPR